MSDAKGKKHNANNEPLIHITRRTEMEWKKAWLIRLVAIVASLIVCAIVMTLATGLDPISVYQSMIDGSFQSSRKMWILGKEAALLLCVALALTPAFKMKFWNLGGEGQIMIGALATAACMIYLGESLPEPALMIVMFVVRKKLYRII